MPAAWQRPVVGPFTSPGSIIVDALAGLSGQLAEQSFNAEAKRVADEQTARGLAAGRQAAMSGAPIPQRSDYGTVGGDAFNAAGKKGYLLHTAVANRSELGALAEQHAADPDAFAEALKGVREKYQGLPEDVSVAVQSDIDDLGGRYLDKLRGEQRDTVQQQTLADGMELSDSLNREAANAARQGNAAGVAKAREQHQALINTLVNDRVITGMQARGALKAFDREAAQHGVLGAFEGAYRDGGVDGARQFVAAFKSDKHPEIDPDLYDALARRMDATIDDADRETRRAAREQKAVDNQE